MSDQSRTQILAAIWSLVREYGATVPAVERQSALLELDGVVAEAAAFDGTVSSLGEVAGAVILRLEQAADSLEVDYASHNVPNRSKAARAALGLASGLGNRPLKAVKGRKGRAESIAEWLDQDKASLEKQRQDGTSPLGELVEGLAEAMFKREIAERLSEKRLSQRTRRHPLESAMQINWLTRFESYYKLWTAASGVRHDLEQALSYRACNEDGTAALFTRKSLYFYAQYLAELNRFQDEYGGLWIFPNTKTEDALADSTWLIRKPIPLGEVAESIIRLTYEQTPAMAFFMHATFAKPYLGEIIELWSRWVQSCSCADLDGDPRDDCDVHRTIGWIKLYMDGLDAQWDFLIDWYALPRPGSVIDPVKIDRGDFPTPPDSSLT
jgi:hypothetical protein